MPTETRMIQLRRRVAKSLLTTNWPRYRRALGRILLYTLIIAGAIIELIPLYWMLASSLKPIGELYRIPPKWVPSRLEWINYVKAFNYLPFGRFFLNTVVIVVFTMAGSVLSSSLVAFSFARLRWPGCDRIFVLLLTSMMIPAASTIIPEYIIFKHLNMVNTFYPLILPTYLAPAFYVFMLRQFFLTIPREMDDAARIDGCSNFRIYWQIMMPLAKPALGVVAIYQFRGAWNDFFRPIIYIHDKAKFTLSVGLDLMKSGGIGEAGEPWNQIMAVSLVATLPMLLVFFFLQRMFIQGIVVTGVKG